ncbi:MAG: CRISPR-associated helicase Cas3' [Bacteroidota bacterium]
MDFYSHPGKFLEVHIQGVLRKMQKRTHLKIAEIAVLFHDLGKINPNFQKKLDPVNKGQALGYSGHSYLSTFAFFCYLANNKQDLKEALSVIDESALKLEIQRIVAIIAHHHGNLPDLCKNLKQDPKQDVLEFLSKDNPLLPMSEFYQNKLGQHHQSFNLDLGENTMKARFFELCSFLDGSKEANLWKQDALNYFLDTQFAFASLIEADKRDAGDNESYFYEQEINNSVAELSSSLEKAFSNLTLDTPLNKQRTQIRVEALEGLKKGLEAKRRVLTLAAPTGAGKTYALLALASEIQRNRPDLGILYALPFLSITEQVEDICRRPTDNSIEKGLLKEVLSVNSKAMNERIQQAQADLEKDQNEENLKRLLGEDFIGQTFDHPFVITTFVQLFETLVSNRNSTLLKLPNFAKRIFLIDEVQALPPRLYIFFTAWLDAFCRKYDSYAILSTATMPHFSIPIKKFVEEDKQPALLFKSFQEPFPILDAEKFFAEDVFNRYRINLINDDSFTVKQLTAHITSQEKSSLIILNTIEDTKQLFAQLKTLPNVYLLNTHFTPVDRREKIRIIKQHLEKKEKVILISTQLIEAGVDIDFPIVYRDLCPLPSLIQSAGRCNRNKKQLELGQIYFFHLIKENGKSSANLIYRKEARQFLEYCHKNIKDGLEEKDLYKVQSDFFQIIANDLTIGEVDDEFNMIECVNKAQFEKLGQFKLIKDKDFGSEYQYYIPKNENDREYNKAVGIMWKMLAEKEYEHSKRYKIELSQQLKKLADRTITIRIFEEKKWSIPAKSNEPEYFNIKVLADISLYTFKEGFNHSSVENSFL